MKKRNNKNTDFKKLLNRIVFCLAGSLLFFSSNLSAQDKNILVLHSYHKGLSWTETVIQGVESVFSNKILNQYHVKIYYEYMDTKRFDSEDYMDKLVPVLKYKASKVQYDAVISVDDNALHFLLKHRQEIFGNIPVVFCGVNFYSPELLSGTENYTGIVEAFAARETVDLALKLHPDTREFVVVGDDTLTSQNNNKVISGIEKDYRDRGITFRYLTDSNLGNYQQILSELNKGSVVLAMLFNRDDKGKFYTYEESFDIYSARTKVPIYTYWDFYLGRGAVGGKIISGFNQGEAAAQAALRILEGVSIKTIPVKTESPNEFIFDYNAFVKNSISIAQLPSPRKILGEPLSFSDIYERYKEVILGILLLLVFLIVVIIVLVFNIYRRIKMEHQLVATNKAYYRFVPREFLDSLEKDDIIDVMPGDAVLKNMTVLFSDIRSFTTLSENMTPQQNFQFINEYLGFISPAIRNHNGFIDKFIGDAIMALFPGRPDDGVQAAIEMQSRLADYNILRKSRGEMPIRIGIGLHTGSLMLGTVGDQNRMEGTVISDAVNLASRLESITKNYGATMVVSSELLDNLGDKAEKYLKRFLGNVQVKGKSKWVSIYEMLDGRDSLEKEAMIKSKSYFEHAVKMYFKKDFQESKKYFQHSLKVYPDDKAVQHYLNEIK